MGDDTIDIRAECGGVVACADDKADMEHRWWFDTTDGDTLVFAAEIIEDRVGENQPAVRHYVESHEADVPEKVRDAIDEEGFEGVVVEDYGGGAEVND